jgi:hypothetical protein
MMDLRYNHRFVHHHSMLMDPEVEKYDLIKNG